MGLNMQQRGGGWPTGGGGPTPAGGQSGWVVGANPVDRGIPLGQVWNDNHEETPWAVTLAALAKFGPSAANVVLDQAMWQAQLDYGNDFAQQTALLDWPVGGATFTLTAGFVRLSAVSRYGATANLSALGTAVQGQGWISKVPGGGAALRGDPPTWTTPSQIAQWGTSPVYFAANFDVPPRARWYRVIGYTQALAPNGQVFGANLEQPLAFLAKGGFAARIAQWIHPGGAASGGAVQAVDWYVTPDVDSGVPGAALPSVAFANYDVSAWKPLHPRTASLSFESQKAQTTTAAAPNTVVAIQFGLDLG